MSLTGWDNASVTGIKVGSWEHRDYEKVDTIGFVGSFLSDGDCWL
jgi:hypothetical protein